MLIERLAAGITEHTTNGPVYETFLSPTDAKTVEKLAYRSS